MKTDLDKFEEQIKNHVQSQMDGSDPAHDFAHFGRVVVAAKKLCKTENAKMEIVMPAAWLHDLVNVPKNDPRRSQASKFSGEAACAFLKSIRYPEEHFPEIQHAIEAHSFSANIETKTLEAAIVQDADRLDALGAIGIARMFAVSGMLKRPLYNAEDPFAENGRKLDDLQNTLDHFFVKLFKIVETLKTKTGQKEGRQRATFMRAFLDQLKTNELSHQ